MAKNEQYLEFHGQQWRVVVFIPRKLHSVLGRTRLKQALGTSDLRAANEAKWPVVARMKGVIAQAQRAVASNDPLEAEALKARLHADDEGTQYWLYDRAEQIEETHGPDAAKEFYKLGSGQTTPLDMHQDSFLSFKANYRLKTQGDFKRVLGWLGEWLRLQHHAASLEAVTRKTAGQFIEEFLCVGRSRDKATAYLGFLREFWRWLIHPDDAYREYDPVTPMVLVVTGHRRRTGCHYETERRQESQGRCRGGKTHQDHRTLEESGPDPHRHRRHDERHGDSDLKGRQVVSYSGDEGSGAGFRIGGLDSPPSLAHLTAN
jgi:hypothetical protein